jgi:hypothetical protein
VLSHWRRSAGLIYIWHVVFSSCHLTRRMSSPRRGSVRFACWRVSIYDYIRFHKRIDCSSASLAQTQPLLFFIL